MALKQWVLQPLHSLSFFILTATTLLVRFVSMVALGVMAYQYIQQNRKGWAITFGAIALLFQPFIKVALGRVVWNIVDVLVAVLLIVVWIKGRKKDTLT